jgi:hypothetical protein
VPCRNASSHEALVPPGGVEMLHHMKRWCRLEVSKCFIR